MNLKKVFKKDNVFQYLVILKNTHILICIKDKFIESRNLRDFEIDWKNENYCRLGTFTIQNNLKVSNSQLKGKFISIENGNVNHEVGEKFENYICNKYFKNMGLLGSIGEPIISALYDLQTDKILWEREYINDVWGIHEKGIYARGDKMESVEFYSLENGSHLWQYSVSEIGKYTDTDNYFKPYQHEGEVRKIIGVCGDILLVVISGGFEGKNNVSSQLIGLSCQSGELLWRLDMFNSNGIYTGYGSYENLQIDESNHRLLGFYSQGFIEIDAKLGKVKRFCHLSYTNKEMLQFYHQERLLTNVYAETLVGEHLYFKATNIANKRHSLSSNVIGAYNHQTEKIDWLYEFIDLGPSVSIRESPKVEGNRLYALDSGSTLHIFERE